MLHVVIYFQVRARFEPHQSHTNSIKLFNLFNFILSNHHLLTAERVVGSDLLTVKDLTCLFADVPLSTAQLFTCLSIDLRVHWLLSGHHSIKKGQGDLRARRQVEHTLALSSLSKLFLSNSFHQLEQA